MANALVLIQNFLANKEATIRLFGELPDGYLVAYASKGTEWVAFFTMGNLDNRPRLFLEWKLRAVGLK